MRDQGRPWWTVEDGQMGPKTVVCPLFVQPSAKFLAEFSDGGFEYALAVLG